MRLNETRVSLTMNLMDYSVDGEPLNSQLAVYNFCTGGSTGAVRLAAGRRKGR
jgi:hypothetical protein